MSNAPMRQPRGGTASAPPAPSKIFQLEDITSTVKPTPTRWGFYATNGFGKTSLLAFAPSPIFIETKGETGLETLINSGQLPPTPHFPEIEAWDDLQAAIRTLATTEHTFKTLVLDTANGAERMMHEFICERDYGGDWDGKDHGFLAWGGKGFEASLGEWRGFLQSLDNLRKTKGMTIFFLMHSKVKTFKNPAGSDFDKYTPEMNEKTWSLTKGWLDATVFGNYEVIVNTGKKVDVTKKGKAAETSSRILYTNSENPVYDAKNRLGLADEIEMGDSPKQGWANLVAAVKEGRKAQPEVA